MAGLGLAGVADAGSSAQTTRATRRMVVEAAEPSNVDTVFVDGRILKRGGKFTALDPDQIVADAVVTRDAVRSRI